MSKRYVTTLTVAGWLVIFAGAVDAQSPSISFGDGQWTDLNAVCTAYHTLNGFTDNK